MLSYDQTKWEELDMFCKKCGIPMSKVMSFSDEGNFEYYRCSKCLYETRKKPLVFDNKKGKQEKDKQNDKKKPKYRKKRDT